VNGDGGADLLVGSPGAVAATKNGQAAVLFGSVRGSGGGAPAPSAPPSPPIGQANRSPDSSIRSPRLPRQSAMRLRTIRGVASDDKELARVEVSLVRYTGSGAKRRCFAMRSAGTFRRYGARAGTCRPAGFLMAKGTATWSLALKRRLPAGAYLLTSRAVDAQGLKELASSAKDHTRVVFRVR
jgi:hypothetical protein